MKFNIWLRRTKNGKSPLTAAGKKTKRSAMRNGKSFKQANVLSFKVDNFQRASKAKGIRSMRKKRSSSFYEKVY